MRRKVFYFLLFTLFAVNCMAFNISVDTTKTSKKADNPLIEDFKISNFYVKTGEASFKGMNAAILSPITMTTSIDSITDSIFTDRLLAIEYKGRRWVYSNVIRNTEADTMLSFEEIRTGKVGIELSYVGGQGYKYDYQILINMSDGQPCLTNMKVTSLFIVTDAISQCSYGWETMKPLVSNALHYRPHKS